MPISATHEKYANFYTDFAFKKLFGTEANKECLIGFLNSLFDGEEEILDMKNLNSLMERPKALQEAVFKRFFEAAEIANFTPNEMYDYRESQKQMWDLYSVTTTAEKKGIAKGRAEGEHNKAVDIAKKLLTSGLGIEFVAQSTGLSVDELKSIL